MESNIYFGKVVNVEDSEFICRCQVTIVGVTDELPVKDLPWYYSWYGRNYLPEVDDEVAVIIFDMNFSVGFYGRKLDIADAGVEEGDYVNYLEIFKRNCDGDDVQLTYKKSTGIEFINKEGKAQIEIDKISLFAKANSIIMTEDRIDIGNKGLEAVIQGNKGVKELHDIIKHQANIIDKMYQGFQKIIAGCTNPFTIAIASQLSPHLMTQIELINENTQVDMAADKIQSKMVFTNE